MSEIKLERSDEDPIDLYEMIVAKCSFCRKKHHLVYFYGFEPRSIGFIRSNACKRFRDEMKGRYGGRITLEDLGQ